METPETAGMRTIHEIGSHAAAGFPVSVNPLRRSQPLQSLPITPRGYPYPYHAKEMHMPQPRILFVIGSLRKGSFNQRLADVAAKHLDGRAEISTLDYRDLPQFDQGEEFPAPPSIADAREQVSQADAVWIFTPEYNYSYPGTLKNLLDWLSRPLDPTFQDKTTVLTGKKVALTSAAGKSAGAGVRGKLTEILDFLKSDLLGRQVGIVLPGEAFVTGEYEPSADDVKAVELQADELLDSIGK